MIRLSRLAIVVYAALPVMAAPLIAAPPEPMSDWTERVPSDVRLYVEFRNLSVIRHHLRRAGLWQIVRDLGESAMPRTTTRPWQQRTEQLLGMTSEQAVVRLLGLRTALLTTDPLEWDQGLVLAEVGDEELIRRLLQRWKATALDPMGPVERHRVPGGLLVAHRGRTLLFGPERDERGLWLRTVLLMAGKGGTSLAEEPAFRGLMADVREGFDGLAYVRFTDSGPATTRPSLDRSRAVLARLEFRANEMHCEFRARDPSLPAAEIWSQGSLIATAPADVVFAWSGPFDASAWLGAARGAAPKRPAPAIASLVRPLLTGLARGRAESVSGGFGTSVTLVVSRIEAQDSNAFDRAQAAVLFEHETPAEVVSLLDDVVQLGAWWLTPTSGPDAPTTRPTIQIRRVAERAEVHSIDVGALLAARTSCPFFANMELCWAADGDTFLVATDRRYLASVIRAMRREVPYLAEQEGITQLFPDASTTVDWLMLRGRPTAAMLRSWLAHLERSRPDVLKPDFWRDWARQRMTHQARLGLGLRDSAVPGEAIVAEVAANSPAARFLEVGDVIVAVDGRPLDSEGAARSVRERFLEALPRGRIVFGVQRGETRFNFTIPLPSPLLADPDSFDPIAAVRFLIALLDRVDSVAAWRRASGEGGFRADLRVRWGHSSAAHPGP